MSKKSREPVKSALDEIKTKIESMDNKLDLIIRSMAAPSSSNTYDDLPWKSFKNGEGSWILADQKGAEELVNRLRNAKGNTVFSGGYRFTLSRDGRFVRRHPLKARKEVGIDE